MAIEIIGTDGEIQLSEDILLALGVQHGDDVEMDVQQDCLVLRAAR